MYIYVFLGPFNILLVATSQVDLIDLSGLGRRCIKPSSTSGQSGPIGAFIENINSVMKCGGITGGSYLAECYFYLPHNRSWISAEPMLTPRSGSDLIEFDGQWLITGGRKASGQNLASTEELNTETCRFQQGKDLPATRTFHKLVKISESEMMLLGDAKPTQKTYVYDNNTGMWSESIDNLIKRENSQAGMSVKTNTL